MLPPRRTVAVRPVIVIVVIIIVVSLLSLRSGRFYQRPPPPPPLTYGRAVGEPPPSPRSRPPAANSRSVSYELTRRCGGAVTVLRFYARVVFCVFRTGSTKRRRSRDYTTYRRINNYKIIIITVVPERYGHERRPIVVVAVVVVARFARRRHVAHLSRTVRGRHGPVRVFGQRAGTPTRAAGPLVQPDVAPDQPDRRRAQDPRGAASGECLHMAFRLQRSACTVENHLFVRGGGGGHTRRVGTSGADVIASGEGRGIDLGRCRCRVPFTSPVPFGKRPDGGEKKKKKINDSGTIFFFIFTRA